MAQKKKLRAEKNLNMLGFNLFLVVVDSVQRGIGIL